jgi:hypothetical protein
VTAPPDQQPPSTGLSTLVLVACVVVLAVAFAVAVGADGALAWIAGAVAAAAALATLVAAVRLFAALSYRLHPRDTRPRGGNGSGPS